MSFRVPKDTKNLPVYTLYVHMYLVSRGDIKKFTRCKWNPFSGRGGR